MRVRPGHEWREDVYLLCPTWSRHEYIVFGEPLRQALRRRKQGRDVTLFTAIDRDGSLFLWPIGKNIQHGNNGDWNASARQAALLGESVWVQLFSNHTLKCYEREISRNIPDPVWPDLSFEAMLDTAFADLAIDSEHHDIIRRLWGE